MLVQKQRNISILLLSAYEFSFVWDEAINLAKKHIDVHVVKSRFIKTPTSNIVKYHNPVQPVNKQTIKRLIKNFIFENISLLKKPYKFFWESFFVPSLSSIVKESDIDIIHSHFAYPYGFMGSFVKEETGKPLIVSLHGNDILTEPSVKYGMRLNYALNILIKNTLNKCDAIIVPSKAVLDETKNFVQANDKINLIHHGVDTKIFHPKVDGSTIKKKLGIDAQNKVVLTLKNHEPQYGIEYLIRAVNIVAKQNTKVTFVIGGEGSLRNFHEKLAQKLGVDDKIIFVDRVPREKVPLYCAMSDIAVVSSLQESFGIILTESMACGKPVIGTSVGGIPDQIIDGYNGFLVKPKTHRELADKILLLTNDTKFSRKMGKRGRKIVEKKFDINQKTNELIKVYKSMIGS